MRTNKILLITAMIVSSAFCGIAQNARHSLSIKESINDNNIVYPASLETGSRAMAANWYLQNFAIVDNNHSNVLATDNVYRDRLNSLSRQMGVEMTFNPIVKKYIEYYLQRKRTLVAQMLGLCTFYMPYFDRAIGSRRLPRALRCVPLAGSALDANAVSPAGAGGLWHFMVLTAKGHGLEVNSLVDERRDPVKASYAAATYLKKLHDTYGDWLLAIAAYYCEPSNVNKAVRRAEVNGVSHPGFWDIYNFLPRNTRGYVPAFIATNYVMAFHREHNIGSAPARRRLDVDSVMVDQRVNLNQVAQVLNIPIDELRFLNPQYRNDVIPGNIHPYALTLPAQYVYSYRRNRDRIASHDRELYAVRDEVQPGESKEDYQPHLARAVIEPIDEAPVSRRRSVSIAYNDSPRPASYTPASYPPANYSGHAGSDYRQVPAARARQEKGTTTQVPVPVKRKSYVVNPSQQY